MYLRNCWYMAGWSADFGASAPVPLTLLDEPLVFYRAASGALVALEDRCCHRLAPLSHGRVEGDDLRCLYHGLKFAPTGACIEVPGRASVPSTMKVRSFPVIERHSAAWIWMGAPAAADPALIPDFVGVEDPAWRMLPGHMDYDANFRLIQDNLLDLSHVAWVHRNTFGRGSDATTQAWRDAELRVTALPRGVRVERWMPGAPTAPDSIAIAGPRCDTLSRFDFLVPGIFLLNTSNYHLGAAQRAGSDRPAEEPFFSSFTAQAVAPLTARTTRYFFAFGPWSRAPGADRMKFAFRDLALAAFAEDKAMLEAQQKVIDADPARPMILFEVDKAPVLYGRLVEKLLAAEREGSSPSAASVISAGTA
jgi:vanillate O-demethylase monooxygenase subunit